MRQAATAWMGKWVKPGYRHSSTLSPEYRVGHQVNLMATLVVVILTIGYITHFIQGFANYSIALVTASFPVLGSVLLLNRYRQFELANVLFYIIVNVISAVLSREMALPSTTTVLGLFLSLCLLVFLFQKASTRIICGIVVVFRILLLESNASLLGNSAASVSRYVVDGMELFLIVLVLTMYVLQTKAIEASKIQNELFLQHMTHDLQVGFRALSTMIEHAKRVSDKKGPNEISNEKIEEFANASRFYGYILNNFLEFARKENKSLEANWYEEMDLAYELATIVDLHQYMADEKKVSIHVEIDDHLPGLIVSDKIKVRRIVLNLLINAINHSPSGSAIRIAVECDGPSWQLTVANEGKGLRQEQIQQLFLPYPVAGRGTESKRLGLGLPITKVLAEALGGRITATSELNKETHFTVAFPVHRNAS